jgi:hypothetical protein
MRSGLLSDLAVVGYEIFLEGDNVKLMYRRSGNPPDTVKPLIDELKICKAEVVNILKSLDIITPSEIVKSGATSQAIWKNPFPIGSIEARQESLDQVVTAIWEMAFNHIAAIWPQGFLSTPEIRAAEIEVERVQALVLSDKAKLADFRKAVESWEKRINEAISIAGLEKDRLNKIST